MNVSRGPIREAVKKLEQEGLLTRNDRNQLFLYKITKEDLINVYECREVMEPLAAKLAAKRITKLNKEKLKKVIDKKRELVYKSDSIELKDEIAQEFTELCSVFHDIILKSSKNERLSQLINQLREITIFYKHYKLQVDMRREIVYAEHKNIFDAIYIQDEKLSESLMRTHLSTDLVHLLERF